MKSFVVLIFAILTNVAVSIDIKMNTIVNNGVTATLTPNGAIGPWGFKTDCVNFVSDLPITKVEVDGVLYWYPSYDNLNKGKVTLCDQIELNEFTENVGLPGGVTIEQPSLPTMTMKVWCGERCSHFTWKRKVLPIDQQIPEGVKKD